MRNVLLACIVLFSTAGTAFSEEARQPRKEIAVDLGGGVKLKMVLIPAGEFAMGSRESAEETAAFFNKTYGGESRSKAGSFRTSIRSTAFGSPSRSTWASATSRGASFGSLSPTRGTRPDAEKGETPDIWGWDPEKKNFGFKRSIAGGTRVSSRPTSIPWST